MDWEIGQTGWRATSAQDVVFDGSCEDIRIMLPMTIAI
jgi:hypothetical protein